VHKSSQDTETYSVGKVRSRTQATELVLVLVFCFMYD
jgi:hypothetical protein